jgi:hypothetical protein
VCLLSTCVNVSYTVKPRYLDLNGTEQKFQDIRGFEKLRVKYLENKWLSMVFEIAMLNCM